MLTAQKAIKEGKFAKAYNDFNSAISKTEKTKHASRASILTNMIYCRYEQGDLAADKSKFIEAMKFYKQAIIVGKEPTDIFKTLESEYKTKLEKFEKSKKRLLPPMPPESSGAWYNVGYTYYRMSLVATNTTDTDSAKYRLKAIEYTKHAISQYPPLSNAHNLHGLLLLGERNTEGAEAHFKTAISLNPNNPEPHYNLARLILVDESYGSEADLKSHLRAYKKLGGKADISWVDSKLQSLLNK